MFKVLAFGLFIASFSSIAITAAEASEFTSKSGNLKITEYKSVPVYGSNCNSRKVDGTYRTQDGIAGTLHPMCSKNRPSDIGYYTFEDRRGTERCKGRMAISLSGDISGGSYVVAKWAVDGTVPGYRCKTVGQTFEVKMGETSS